MIDLNLEPVANQSFSFQNEQTRYNLTIKETNGVMSATIIRDGVTIVSNARICAGEPLLPYKYQEDGNFVILTQNDELPYWTSFGVSQFLVFVTQDEIDGLRN